MPSAAPTTSDPSRQRLAALGAVLVRRRKALGMTQEEVEEIAAVHVTHLRGIEAGRRNPSYLVLWRIVDALGMPFSALCAEVEAEVSAAGGSENQDA